MMRLSFWYHGLLCLAQVGCATWDAPTADDLLPTPQLAPDGVVLEIEFVRLPDAMASEVDQIWLQVDEQHVSTDLRRQFGANGFRSGLLGAQLPGSLRNLLDAEKPALEQLADGSIPEDADVFSNYQRLQCRTGRRKRFVASPQLTGNTVVMLSEDGTLRGEPFEQPQGQFTVTTFPQGDGRVRILLTPAIEHGQPRQRYGSAQGTLTIQTGREQTSYDQLQIDTVLSPGQTLLVSCTPEPRGLGRLFFAASVGRGDRSMMLVRLAQSQMDDLFSKDRTPSPLTTPVE